MDICSNPITSIDKIKCCLESNLPFIDDCHNICTTLQNTNKKILCKKICSDIAEISEDSCQLLGKLQGTNNPIYPAIRKFGCGVGYGFPVDPVCMRKMKNNILEKCQTDCLPTMDVDCQKHCKYSYDNLLQKYASDFSNNYYSNYEDNNKKNNFIYVMIVGLLLLLFVILMIIRK